MNSKEILIDRPGTSAKISVKTSKQLISKKRRQHLDVERLPSRASTIEAKFLPTFHGLRVLQPGHGYLLAILLIKWSKAQAEEAATRGGCFSPAAKEAANCSECSKGMNRGAIHKHVLMPTCSYPWRKRRNPLNKRKSAGKCWVPRALRRSRRGPSRIEPNARTAASRKCQSVLAKFSSINLRKAGNFKRSSATTEA